MATTPDERKFITFRRGDIRDNVILQNFRNRLRTLINPDTGNIFTEDEITTATNQLSRFWIEADAIDVVTQASQARARYMANQLRPKWSNTNFLDAYWGPLWLGEDSRLPATGASGTVNAAATTGSIFPGSTTIGDAAAAVATDPAGNQYQVLQTETTPASGVASLSMQGVDTGVVTNIDSGTILTWSKNAPLGAQPTATTSSDFEGGFDIETDVEYADRIEQFIRNRPASGNSAQFVQWARASSNAIETAFVYPTAFYAGSVLVSILQKRGENTAPNARTNVSLGTLIAATNYLVPPNSPVVPQNVYVVVVPPTEQPSDIAVKISLGFGVTGGWADVTPWPNPSTTSLFPEVKVISVTSQTEFDVETDSEMPGLATILTGDDAPQIMHWDKDNSLWEQLDVNEISKSGTTYTIKLNSSPTATIAVDDRISPYTDRLNIISDAIVDYFDELGPGEVVDLSTDPRASRAFRYPTPGEQFPSRAGQAIVSRIIDALGGLVPDAQLDQISQSEPDLPGDIIDGPNMIVLQHCAIYPL